MMTRKKKIKLVILITVIIVLSNVFPLHSFIVLIERDAGYYLYSRKNDTTTLFDENGKDPERLVYFQWREDTNYIKEHPGFLKDTVYRNFRINPLLFWHWKDYFLDERYTLPYISREDVFKNARLKKIDSLKH